MFDTIMSRVIATIEGQLYLTAGSVSPTSTFAELGIDSLTGLNLVYEMEKEFGVEVPNDQVLLIRSVDQIVACLEPLVGPNGVNPGEPARSPA
jgi:acyl carrier protein